MHSFCLPTRHSPEGFAYAKRNAVVIFAHTIVNTDIYFFVWQHSGSADHHLLRAGNHCEECQQV